MSPEDIERAEKIQAKGFAAAFVADGSAFSLAAALGAGVMAATMP